jgi:hypothetical protein
MKRERHLGKVILQDREGRLECAKCGDDQHANTYQVEEGSPMALSRLFMVSRSWRCHTQRTPAGETVSPRFLSSLATRTWLKAGCSLATTTTASSISYATRFFSTGFLRLILQRQLAAFAVKLLEVHYSCPTPGRDAVNHSRR